MTIAEEIREKVPIIDGDADIWAIFRDPGLFGGVLLHLAAPYAGKVDKVLGAESRGFIVASGVARILDLPFVGVRKDHGFLPGEVVSKESFRDYRGNRHTLRIQREAIKPGDKVLLADDWTETGNQAMCVKHLVEEMGAEFYGMATVVDQTEDERRTELGIFTGLITNTELFGGEAQRDYQAEARGEA